jgi:hypothetical protein
MNRTLFSLCIALFACGNVAAQATSNVITAIEFYAATVDQYFITASIDEVSMLDNGTSWVRTGYTFNVVDPSAIAVAGANPVCRLYGNTPDGPGLHFFSASPQECAQAVANAPDVWIVESDNVFGAFLADAATGACPDGTVPLSRSFGPHTDHRYTTDFSVQSAMLAQGWIAEGYGAPPVAMCLPK